MDDSKYLTIYDVMFPSSELKPYKRLRNYSENEVLRYLEVVPEGRKSAIIPKSNRGILKKLKAHKKLE